MRHARTVYKPHGTPEISVIVPVLDEAETVRKLLLTIENQQNVAAEIILADGGSTDGTLAHAAALTPSLRVPVRIVTGRPGRGLQLNAGAAVATAPHLLFLHADSIFPSPLALRTALDTIFAASTERAAGRFRLIFGDAPAHPGYHFYESKARLGRPWGIHGDQGFVLSRRFFDALGHFDANLPVLEDTLFAERVRQAGTWLLVDADLLTSARRFRSEGLKERQVLNAIIVNLGRLGWWEPLEEIGAMYRRQKDTGALDTGAVVAAVVRMLDQLPEDRRQRVWRETGRFVRDNAWQLAFALDARRQFRLGARAGGDAGVWLRRFDRYVEPLLRNDAAARLAEGLVKLWARQWREKKGQASGGASSANSGPGNSGTFSP